MGDWITLHLFDERTFVERHVPILREEKTGIVEEFINFSEATRTGARPLNESEKKIAEQNAKDIAAISRGFDSNYRQHKSFTELTDGQKYEVRNMPLYYDYSRFFEFLVFKYCSDFFPYLPLGKYGLFNKLETKPYSLAQSLIGELDNCRSIYFSDGSGIGGWLGKNDVELLCLEWENITSVADYPLSKFQNFIEIARQYELGIVMGVNAREHWYERMTAHKLISAEKWKELNKTGLFLANGSKSEE